MHNPQSELDSNSFWAKDCLASSFSRTQRMEQYLGSSAGNDSDKAMTPIDALISAGHFVPPIFLKLDAQGYEIEVWEGWTVGFENCQMIQCEISLLSLVPQRPLLHDFSSSFTGLNASERHGGERIPIIPGHRFDIRAE